jgi:glucose/arabinose dehydrogenase
MKDFVKYVNHLYASATVSLLLALLLCSSGCIGQGLQLDKIKLPEGFRIDVYADNVDGARSMALSTNGTLFVGSRPAGKVYAVLDKDGDNRAEEVVTIASGLNLPNGVAFRDGDLYVAEATRVLRYDDIEAHLNDPPEPAVVKDDLPGDRGHNWKFIPLVSTARCIFLLALLQHPRSWNPYAAHPHNPDGTGFRSLQGGSQHRSIELKASCGSQQRQDWLGEDIPDDELNRAPEEGLHFGYPYCHAGDIPDPEFGMGRNCSEFVPPEAKLGAHVAALGMRFYNGTMFPSEYQNQIFIAEHGSWNRATPIGYRVVLARVENNSVTDTEVFADGWLQGGTSWGRPVDVQVMPDGALLVSDG